MLGVVQRTAGSGADRAYGIWLRFRVLDVENRDALDSGFSVVETICQPWSSKWSHYLRWALQAAGC